MTINKIYARVTKIIKDEVPKLCTLNRKKEQGVFLLIKRANFTGLIFIMTMLLALSRLWDSHIVK